MKTETTESPLILTGEAAQILQLVPDTFATWSVPVACLLPSRPNVASACSTVVWFSGWQTRARRKLPALLIGLSHDDPLAKRCCRTTPHA